MNSGTDWPGVSVVMPVLNEERHLPKAVEHVLLQRYPGPVELIMAVGPSDDRTEQVAAELVAAHDQVRWIENPTGRTPAGLNLAIAASRYDFVVRVDAHGELAPGYLETAVRTLMETGAANVGGLMDAQGTTPFEKAVAAAYNSPLGLGETRSTWSRVQRAPPRPCSWVPSERRHWRSWAVSTRRCTAPRTGI